MWSTMSLPNAFFCWGGNFLSVWVAGFSVSVKEAAAGSCLKIYGPRVVNVLAPLVRILVSREQDLVGLSYEALWGFSLDRRDLCSSGSRQSALAHFEALSQSTPLHYFVPLFNVWDWVRIHGLDQHLPYFVPQRVLKEMYQEGHSR